MIRCSICGVRIGDIHYAIRDMKPTETYFEWLWRHVVRLFAFGLKSRKHAVILPVCDDCATMRLAHNLAGASKKVA
jgi:hypothetical protein